MGQKALKATNAYIQKKWFLNALVASVRMTPSLTHAPTAVAHDTLAKVSSQNLRALHMNRRTGAAAWIDVGVPIMVIGRRLKQPPLKRAFIVLVTTLLVVRTFLVVVINLPC